jgi:archaemetzincin
LNKHSILLITYGHFEKNFLEQVAVDVSNEFQCRIDIEESHIELSEFYDSTRRQYDGNKLLEEIDSMFLSPDIKKIGIFRVDLFIPILTFIFGQAILNGNSGIASLYRLRNEHYGMPQDEELLISRLKKIIIHELGHTFGLLHCHNPTCVMLSSTYVEDIDQKTQKLCTKCKKLVD